MLIGHICNDCPLMAEAPAFRRVRSFFGTHAYVVHRRGLQKIFAYPRLMPAEKQIDASEWGWADGGRDVQADGCRRGAASACSGPTSCLPACLPAC